MLMALAGCTSSNNRAPQQLPDDLITLQQPGDNPHKPSRVYIDSVTKVTTEKKPTLLIQGTLPDACTKLQDVTHDIQDDTITLTFKAWRNPEMMCAQVLTSFSYLYDKLDKKELSTHSSVTINGTVYSY